MKIYSSTVPSLRVDTPVKMDNIKFDKGQFRTDDEDVIDWLDAQLKVNPALGQRVRCIDMEAAAKMAAAQMNQLGIAVKGGVTSGNEQATAAAQMAGAMDPFANAKPAEEAEDKPKAAAPKIKTGK